MQKGIKVNLTRIRGSKKEKVLDLVAKEVNFTIFLNGKKLITLNCSPEKFDYLGIGFLYTSGMLQKREDIKSIDLDRKQNLMHIKIEDVSLAQEDICGKDILLGTNHIKKWQNKFLPLECSLKIKSSLIFSLISKIQKEAVFFKLTGGTHNCVLAERDGSIILFSEDISRYNTIYKILGEALINDILPEDKIILTSCRITSGILKKIIVGKMPIIISRAAPTDQAIELAQKIGITLVGFAREERMNVYTHPGRIEI